MKKEKTLIDNCYYQTNKKFWDSTEKKNIIYCHQSKKHYWDNGMIRNFEEVVEYNVTWKEAKKKFPNCINI